MLLQNEVPLMDPDLQQSGFEVTTKPPDIARKGVTKSQLNLFLYQTTINAAWRNLEMPRQTRPGELAPPPLAINLYYLITPFGLGEADDEAISHRVLGAAMSILSDHALLGPDEIKNAFNGSGLETQIERVRITLQPLDIEQMFRLWSAFQTQYRLSAAYELSVVLIDSNNPTKAGLPVFRRGSADTGPSAITGGAPILETAVPPRFQPSVQLGDDLLVTGQALSASAVVARFVARPAGNPVDLPAQAADGGALRVHIPNAAEDAQALARWQPGGYQLSLVPKTKGLPPSNSLDVSLAPSITVSPNNAQPGDVALTIECAPRLQQDQVVFIVFGDQTPLAPQTITTPADKTKPTVLTLTIPAVRQGTYVVRLRVDGVDSLPVVYTGAPPLPAFDPKQQVIVA
jgi:hypothetical protein